MRHREAQKARKLNLFAPFCGQGGRAVDKVWLRRPACGFWRCPAVKSGTITGRDARLTRRRGRLRYYVNGPGQGGFKIGAGTAMSARFWLPIKFARTRLPALQSRQCWLFSHFAKCGIKATKYPVS